MNYHQKPHKRFTIYDWPEDSKKNAKHIAIEMGITLQRLVILAVDKYVKEQK